MDDKVLWSANKAELKDAMARINDHVMTVLKCMLKPEILNRSKFGLSFLGYRIFPYYVRLTQQSKKRFLRKLRLVEEHYHSGEWDEAYCQSKVLPLLAFTKHADSLELRKEILSLL